jgi:3-oxoacyl-[acyl-carrier-protein] synthase II
LNFDGPRAGCDLDYVPNAARPAEPQRFLALSAAFGGCNCAIVAGQVGAGLGTSVPAAMDDVVITGMGVISALGCVPQTAFAAAFATEAGEMPDSGVRGFDPRRHLPRGRQARMNAITQYSVAAIEQALTQAGWTERTRRPTALGLLVGLSRGAAGSFQACMESVRGGAWDKASPIAFPNLVMSSVGGMAAVAVGLKGAASTLVGEAEVGLALLGHAATLLSQRPELDALVVLAADELAPLFTQLNATLYGPPVVPLAAGGVALVLERRRAAASRGAVALAQMAGWAQSFAGADDTGSSLAQAMRLAIARGEAGPADIDMAFTLARGEASADQLEAAALRGVFGNHVPSVSALSGHAGWGEASGGLLAVAMAVQALQQGRMPAPGGWLSELGAPWLTAPAAGDFTTGLIAGSSRHGNNAAVLIRKVGADA